MIYKNLNGLLLLSCWKNLPCCVVFFFYTKVNERSYQMKRFTEKHLQPSQTSNAAQKMKFFIKDFLSKCDKIRSFLRIWSALCRYLSHWTKNLKASKWIWHNEVLVDTCVCKSGKIKESIKRSIMTKIHIKQDVYTFWSLIAVRG